jgi:DNA-binding transcriptional ArsR family regulator
MTPSVQFAALADDTRCALVDLLRERPRPVHELAAAFSISRPAVSRHLRVLKDAGLITEERSGRENVYSLKRQRLRVLSTWLEQHWSTKLSRLKDPAEATAPKAQSELDL